MYALNLIREFEIVRMKENEYMKEFVDYVRLELVYLLTKIE